MTLILVILLFGLMILVHELGHLITAKLAGVKCEQFTIGFGPAIFKKSLGGTLYALRLLPIGGALIMKGESGEEQILVGKTDESKDGKSFNDVSALKRIIICFAGSFMNFLSGVLILLILFMPVKAVISPEITGFMDGFAFEGEQGFQKGDIIKDVNGFHVYLYSDLLSALSIYGDENMDITVEREGESVTLYDLPLKKSVMDNGTPKYGFIFGVQELTLKDRFVYALKNTASFVQSAVKSIEMLFSGKVGIKDVMGTVGIAGEMTKQAQSSLSDLWYFVAYISVNLAFINMLPIPALDGGKILFIIIEKIRGKRMDPKIESAISSAFLMLILAFFVIVTVNDIVRIIG